MDTEKMTTEGLQEAARRAEAEAELAKAQLSSASARAELALLEGTSVKLVNRDIPFQWISAAESYGNSRHELPAYRLSSFSTGDYQDRSGDKYHPFYETEQELQQARAECRNLYAFSSTAHGAIGSLSSYTIGVGPDIEAEPIKEGDAEQLVKLANYVIDSFLAENSFDGGLDLELHERSRIDGEAIIGLIPEGWRTRTLIIEPEQIVEPLRPLPIEQWLGISHKLNYWTYGIHTQHDDKMKRNDPTNILGYHVVFDQIGDDWEYYPEHRIEFIKRNVPVNAPRGISDFVSVISDLQREEKLRRNTAEGAAIQAAIAFIREHVPGASPSSITSLVQSNATASHTHPRDAGDTTEDIYTEKFAPGTIKDIPKGMTYHAGPMGQMRTPIFLEVAQYLRRSIGMRWSMPEYLISSDASNTNYASTLVAEAPFVKARQQDQEFYARHFRSLLWKVLRIAVEGGRFGGITLQELRQAIRVKVTLPEVASRNKLEHAQVSELEHKAGILSLRTWATETDRDYDEERQRIEKEPQPMMAPPFGGSEPGQPGQPIPFGQQQQQQQPQRSSQQAAIESMLREQWEDLEGKEVSLKVAE